jgi:uncharacterized protein (TIGR02217 family)
MSTLVILPESVAYGFRSAAGGWSTGIVPLGGGLESRNQNWAFPRRRYEFAFGDKSQADIKTVMDFFESRRGSLYPWQFKDWLNFQLTDELILTASGGETAAQVKQTLGTADTFSRDVGHIKAGYIVKKNGSTLTGGGVNYTLNTTTGAITGLSALSGGDLITVTLEFYIKVRFEQDMLAPSIQYFNTARIDSISAIELLS